MFNGSFQEAIAPILIMAQCFAVMPVIGVKSGSASKMYFKWLSFRTLYSIVVCIAIALLTGCTIGAAFRKNIQFESIGL